MPKENTFIRIARCFHIGDNFGDLYNKTSPTTNDQLTAVAGFRTTLCNWVVLFHVNYHSAFTLSNVAQLLVKTEWLSYQPVFQAVFYVDGFFIIRYGFFKVM